MTDLDSILTPIECAAWLGITPAELKKKSRGSRSQIPCFNIGHKTKRYSPRIVLAKLACDAQLPMDVVAAALQKGKR